MTDRDYGYEAQQAAEARLQACELALEAESEGVEKPNWPEDLMAPYCGCLTCQVRETLTAAWPIVEEYARNNP